MFPGPESPLFDSPTLELLTPKLPTEQELLSQARSIQSISIELQEALAKFRLDGSKGRTAVFVKAVQSAWYAKKVEGLSKRLHLRQAAFDTLLLTTGR